MIKILKQKLHHRERERERAHDTVLKDGRAIRFLKKLIRKRIKEQKNHVRVMYDSVTISEIPKNAPAVAGYTSGNWPTFRSLKTEFPGAHLVSIAIDKHHVADCLDVETGDASPFDIPYWLKLVRGKGGTPIIYSSVSQMPLILQILSEHGISRDSVRLWTAHYTFHPHICGPNSCGELTETTADATQWTDHSLGRNLDESRCGPHFFT